jgi:hypothetical protein
VTALALLAGVTTAACSETRTSQGGVQPVPAPSAPDRLDAAGPSPASSTSGAALSDAGAYDGPWLGSIVLQAPIVGNIDWERGREGAAKASRLGYLRYGERVPVIPDARKNANCPEGWYELLAGGFVCGRYATLDPEHPRVKEARSPDLEGALPYVYGYNLANGTPLYYHVPSRKDRVRLEPWLFKPKKAKPAESSTAARGSESSAGGSQESGSIVDAGADPQAEDAGDDAPWWEQQTPDGGPPAVTFEDLQENDGPMSKRMVKGFYLSLDKELTVSGIKWWKTVDGLITPSYRIFVPPKPGSEFHGVWLGKDAASYATKNNPARRIDKLPMAFVLNGHAHKWQLDPARKHVSTVEGELDHFQAVGLTGEVLNLGGYEFWETDEGWWLRGIDMTRTDPSPTPDRIGEREKWVDVNLRRQTLVAFEGTTPVFVTLISSGRNEHETVIGSFRIREKHIAATMHGDADFATDGPYSIEDVPYIEYFSGSYAVHGAFWHSAFGYTKSHGCVNLAPWDAKALFSWTDPELPEGWHAVFATKDRPGSRVVVHGKAPGTCEGPDTDACEEKR